MSEESTVIDNNEAEKKDDCPPSPEIHFEPVIKLPLVTIKTLEEDEEELVKLRAKLYRFDSAEQPGEWKERGTGEVKLLKNNPKKCIRVLMRRDKTLKICANHLVQSFMELKPNCGSDKAWVWSTPADYADEEPKPELLAIKFGNAENAQKFKTAFDAARKYAMEEFKDENGETDEVSEKLGNLNITTEDKKESSESPAEETSTQSSSSKEEEEKENKADDTSKVES